MKETQDTLALRSTGQRVFKLYDVSERYCVVRIPAEHAWHNDRIETVRHERLRKVKSPVI